ncbi:hypothetical protein MHU86_22830 [Fragilaria crotonensis]|nr:hypothetical protein MHU86_22830 [Fragilaria crotonensis]
MFPKDGSHKEFTVPLNINLVIHRDGEWIMLMLGESILSLLIVDVSDGEDYYVTFYCGILTVVSLHYLHYRSQPHDADDHATRRHKDAGIWWSMVNAVYSASLIAVGVSYKLFMYEFTYGERRLENGEDSLIERDLAGGVGLTSDERRQAAANVFSAAITLVFVCLDLMILLHRGLNSSINRCQCPKTKVMNWNGILLTVARISLALFFATLSQYATNPQHLSVLGLAGVVAQLIIRKLGRIIFLDREKDEAEEDNCEGEKMQQDIEETLSKGHNEADDVPSEDVAGHETNEFAHQKDAGEAVCQDP